MEFTKVIRDRYSCKKYSDRQVEKEKTGCDPGGRTPCTDSKESAGAKNLCGSVCRRSC